MENHRLLTLLESVLGKSKKTSGDNVAFFSPFTQHYKPKLEINLKTDHHGNNPWHCWISDEKGKSIYSLFKKLKLSKEYFEQLNKIIKNSKFRSFKSGELNHEYKLKLPNEYSPLWIPKKTPDYKNAMKYLKSRGITIFDILRYRIGYAESGRYAGKIIIPSYDCHGKLNYFISRAFYDADTQKYKNPDVSKDIIGFELYINWKEPIILCEGIFDAMTIKRNAIPLFGKSIQTKLQKKIIEEHVKSIYICLDQDALKQALDISEKFMNEGINVYFVELNENDPNDLGFDQIINQIQETVPMTFETLMKYRMSLIFK